MNLSSASKTFDLKLDLRALGLAGTLHAENLQYPEKTVMRDNVLTVENVPPGEYRTIRLTAKDK